MASDTTTQTAVCKHCSRRIVPGELPVVRDGQQIGTVTEWYTPPVAGAMVCAMDLDPTECPDNIQGGHGEWGYGDHEPATTEETTR